MALEAGDGFISGLVATNPVNATDQVAQGDDHLRLIKTALLGTFPNLNGAVTASPAELNILDGATLSTAELNILDGVTLTAAQINEAARLSVANVFTAAPQAVSAAGAAWRLDQSNAGADMRNTLLRSAGPGFRITSAADATPTTAASDVFRADRSGTTWTTCILTATAITLTGTLSFSGALTTPNTSASEVGFKGAPQNVQDGNYTLVLTDAGKSIDKQAGGAGETITIPANASVAFPIGTIICGDNDGGGDLSIAITSDTLEDSAGNTGTRTVADNGSWQIKKIAATKWRITGTGIS